MKKNWFINRIIFSFKAIPSRVLHLFYPFHHIFFARLSFTQKLASFLFQFSDLFFLFDIYEITTNLIKKSTQTLTNEEIILGKSIFKNQIDWNVVMYDKGAWSAKPNFCLAYVSFNSINTRQNLSDDILIHEMTHVWQYQNFGAGYIVNALAAQKSIERYNYAYYYDWMETKDILKFNAEQQADLIQDFFLIKKGEKAHWLTSNTSNHEKLNSFLNRFDA